MEFHAVHSLSPLHHDVVVGWLREVLPWRCLHSRAALGVAVVGPWRPADLWADAPERVVWSVAFDTPGPLLSKEGVIALGTRGVARRFAPVHPSEWVARRAGDALVLAFSDSGRMSYAATWRERQLRWSLLLEDRVRLVRCDGDQVMVESPPPPAFPEEDRTGVLRAGLCAWLREELTLDAHGLLELPDVLGRIGHEDDLDWIVRDGAWVEDARAARKVV